MTEKNIGNKIKNWSTKALQSIWKWLKSNWLLILVVLAVVFFAWRGCEKDDAYQTLFDQYKESISDHQEQIKILQSIQKKEQEAREEQYRKFLEEINRIEREYKEELSKIADKRRGRQRQIVDDAERDPNTLTRRIQETFGIPIEE